ncbi:MAG: site-specific DNA-methyltransferase [Ignavibacteria bacterium]|jgi:adenine-specific DNA-methyltransferase|nr:site-specific DNA-methyltransferase [Ignavibacteria bacterium]
MIEEQRITNDIKLPNYDLEVLRMNFPHCFDKDGNFQLEKFKNNLSEKGINFSTESFGLDWLGKSYARLLASNPATTLLKAVEIHNTKPENINSENLLIKGDNLEVLKHLSNAYYEQVKMIYIDPPYNTGSDGFVYQDDRKFTVEELQQFIGIDAEKAKRILDFTKSKSNSHSAWLTFLYPRLYIAKQLLKDDGVIFVSIDDNEVAQLRLLMDEIFGEENFVSEFVRKTKSISSDSKIGINSQHEYCISYSKNIEKVQLVGFEKEYKAYSNPDNDPKGEWAASDPTAMDDGRLKKNIKPITNPYTGKIDRPGNGRRWRFNEDGYQKLINEGRIIFKKKHRDTERGFILKRYKNELQSEFNVVQTLLVDNKYLNQFATKELSNFFEFKAFDFPKPTTFILDLVSFIDESEFIIVDFFAGSGTTGDAVMQLNAQDGGCRKYILVQIPELINPKKNKAAYDFVKNELKAAPTIFEITKERLIRVAAKIKKEKKDYTGDLGFKIFETIPIWEDYDFEAAQFDSSQTLFDESKLTEEDLKALLVTWKTYDGIALTQDLKNIDLNGYSAYYGNNKLYLMNKGFSTDSLKTLLEKIDTDNQFEPKSIIAFGYHMESKSLREISENVKTYNNKKKSDIDFITRY